MARRKPKMDDFSDMLNFEPEKDLGQKELPGGNKPAKVARYSYWHSVKDVRNYQLVVL